MYLNDYKFLITYTHNLYRVLLGIGFMEIKSYKKLVINISQVILDLVILQ